MRGKVSPCLMPKQGAMRYDFVGIPVCPQLAKELVHQALSHFYLISPGSIPRPLGRGNLFK